MSDPQIILLILGGAFTLWQLVLAFLGIAYAAQGRSVNVGIIPGLIAVILFIAAVLV